MSDTKPSGTCAVCMTPQTAPFLLRPAGAGSDRDPSGKGFSARTGMTTKMPGELFSSLDLNPREAEELRIFHDFLVNHIQANGICDVQCMLLWSEWVRVFRRQLTGFPDLIREKEFRTVITERFGVGISEDGFRGAVYPGIRFVP